MYINIFFQEKYDFIYLFIERLECMRENKANFFVIFK
jgi:hypothetical protein